MEPVGFRGEGGRFRRGEIWLPAFACTNTSPAHGEEEEASGEYGWARTMLWESCIDLGRGGMLGFRCDGGMPFDRSHLPASLESADRLSIICDGCERRCNKTGGGGMKKKSGEAARGRIDAG